MRLRRRKVVAVSCSLCGKTFRKGVQALFGHYGVSHRGVDPPAIATLRHSPRLSKCRQVESVVEDRSEASAKVGGYWR